MRKINFILTFLASGPWILYAQQEVRDSSERKWAFSASAYYYVVAEDQNQLSPILRADHGALHLEARYNYEDYQTASVFAGRRFEFGNKIQIGITPMAGIVFGNLNGAAPGVEVDIGFKKFDFYVESEYVIDFADNANSFIYSWGELAIRPIEPLRVGASYQKTRLYQTARTIQWGPFVQYSFWKMTIGTYYFNPFTSSNLLVFSLGLDF